MNEGKIYYIDSTTRLLEKLLERSKRGEIEGIVVGVLEKKDRICETHWTGLTYLQRLGIAENVKLVIFEKSR